MGISKRKIWVNLSEGLRNISFDLQKVDMHRIFIMVASMFGCDHTFTFYDQRERILDGIKSMVIIREMNAVLRKGELSEYEKKGIRGYNSCADH